MAKQMKSFRLDNDCMNELQIIADKLGITQTDAVELSVRWAFESGLIDGLKNAEKLGGNFSKRERMMSAARDGEIFLTVKSKLWNA